MFTEPPQIKMCRAVHFWISLFGAGDNLLIKSIMREFLKKTNHGYLPKQGLPKKKLFPDYEETETWLFSFKEIKEDTSRKQLDRSLFQ